MSDITTNTCPWQPTERKDPQSPHLGNWHSSDIGGNIRPKSHGPLDSHHVWTTIPTGHFGNFDVRRITYAPGMYWNYYFHLCLNIFQFLKKFFQCPSLFFLHVRPAQVPKNICNHLYIDKYFFLSTIFRFGFEQQLKHNLIYTTIFLFLSLQNTATIFL